jgi:hypothetical protein
MFPDGADLSGIAGIPVSPDSLFSHPVAALTLAGLPSCKDKEAGPIDRQAVLRIIEALEVSKAGPKNARLDLKEKESPAGPPPNFSFAEEEPIRETAILTMPERAAGEEPRKGNGRLYLLGGTIGAGLVLLLLFAYFIPWPAPEPTLTGSVRKQDAPGSIPPPAPGGIEASPSDQSPGKAVSPAPAVGSGEDWPVPQTSDTTVATQTRSSAETGRQTEVASAKPQDSVANRAPKPAGEEKPLPKRNLPAPQESASKNAGSERPISRRPAEPGTYETIKPTAVRATPSDSAEIVDEINRGLRLNVSGSQGDWLIVHSRKRNRTVYVKRDDAMLIAEKSAKGADRELKWKEIELQIQQAISQRGVTGVTVSFIGDTAYLRGSVQTEKERFSAELAARTIPEVTHIHNGIWVGR